MDQASARPCKSRCARAAQQWGTFGRFRYVPSRNLFILCNGVKQNVYFYRLTADKLNPITGVQARAVRKSLEREYPRRGDLGAGGIRGREPQGRDP